LAEGQRVWGLDNFDRLYPESVKRKNLENALTHTSMRLIEGDIRDSVLLEGLFGSVAFDAVVHLAARPGVRASIQTPGECTDVNVGGTLQLLEAMKRHHVSRLVFGSSSSVYGDEGDTPSREQDAADRPISPYAASKRAGELLVHAHHHLNGCSAVCLRFFTVYGPRQRPDLAIHKFSKLLLEGRPIPVYGDGTTARDYTFVDDTVEAIMRAVDLTFRSEPGRPRYDIVNVGRGTPVTLSELIGLLGEMLNVRPKIDRRPEQPGDVSQTMASTARLEESLGFRPPTGIREGLARFADWLSVKSPPNP
jgi:UDP-glucuronate 4-epimerase